MQRVVDLEEILVRTTCGSWWLVWKKFLPWKFNRRDADVSGVLTI